MGTIASPINLPLVGCLAFVFRFDQRDFLGTYITPYLGISNAIEIKQTPQDSEIEAGIMGHHGFAVDVFLDFH